MRTKTAAKPLLVAIGLIATIALVAAVLVGYRLFINRTIDSYGITYAVTANGAVEKIEYLRLPDTTELLTRYRRPRMW
jgi:hypothetical protein